MATKNWKELEGKSWRLDVGSTEKEALKSKEPSKLFITTDNSIVMNGEVIGKKPFKEPSKDIVVCARKAIPLHPRKGMYYFFDRGIRFKTSSIKDGEETFEIPSSGKYYSYASNNEIVEIRPGTILNESNYNIYFKYSDVLIRDYDGPCLVKVCRDGYAFDDGVLKVTRFKKDSYFDENAINFKCRKKYLEVFCGRVLRIVPPIKIYPGYSFDDVQSNGFQLYKLIRRVACKYKKNKETSEYERENIKDGDGVFKARRYRKIYFLHLKRSHKPFYFVGLARRIYIHSRRKNVYGNIVRCRIAKDGNGVFYIKKFV